MKKITRILALTLCMAFLISSLPSYDTPEITTYNRIDADKTGTR